MKQDLKTLAACIVAALTVCTACQQKPQFTIEGTIEGAADSTLYLDHAALTGLQTMDSVKPVQVKARYADMASNYEISGSDNCQKIKELTLKQQELWRRALAVEKDFSLSGAEAQDSLQRMVERYKNEVVMNYIFVEPQKAYAYFALFQTLGRWLIFNPQASGIDMKAFAAVATSWDTFYPEADRSKNLHSISIANQKNQKIIAARNQQVDDEKIVESGV